MSENKVHYNQLGQFIFFLPTQHKNKEDHIGINFYRMACQAILGVIHSNTWPTQQFNIQAQHFWDHQNHSTEVCTLTQAVSLPLWILSMFFS